MLIPIPKYYGWLSPGSWPSGEYWLVEGVSRAGVTAFWKDDPDHRAMDNWAFTPPFAAGFATEADARRAFDLRGQPGDREIRIVLHIWDEPPKIESA